MEIKNLQDLHEWDKNPRTLSRDGYERLKKQLLMGQHSTLLVMPDGTVLGGNMRIKAMRELGWQTAKCITVDFQKESDEGYFAVVDGEPQRSKFYQTKEDGMMAYSLSHNDSAGTYDSEVMANVMPEYNLDWSEFGVSFDEPISLGKLGEELDHDLNKSISKEVKCPHCGKTFIPE